MLAQPDHLAEASSLALIGWLGLAGTAAAYALFVAGLDRTSAPTAGTLSLAEPLLAAALGVFVLHERLGLSGATGAIVLLAGIVIVTLSDARAPHRSSRLPGQVGGAMRADGEHR